MAAHDRIAAYDRQAASRILAELAGAGLFGAVDRRGPVTIGYTATPLHPEAGSHLTGPQLAYLGSFMRPCEPGQVTSATHQIAWTDSDGVANVGHYGPSGLGAVVPVAVRETVLTLWRELAAGPAVTGPASRLDPGAREVLAATTTDQDPVEVFRIGVEATGRALAQHALIADQTPYRTPAGFAAAMREGGLFLAVAAQWYWELQASTYRRGMVPVRLAVGPDGGLRYTAESIGLLRAMKEHTIATAREVMARATGVEGLTVEQAVHRYHDELDLISRQYALLPAGEQPRCLASMTHQIGGARLTVLPVVVDHFVDTFTAVLDDLTVVAVDVPAAQGVITDAWERVFHVPDMNCRHCLATITGVLASMDIAVLEADLATKRFVADFGTRQVRERAFDTIRAGGYTVVPPEPAPPMAA